MTDTESTFLLLLLILSFGIITLAFRNMTQKWERDEIKRKKTKEI